MQDVHWYGMNSPEALPSERLEHAHAVADAARDGHWSTLLTLLEGPFQRDRVNAWRPGGKSGYTPLYQAAHMGAPLEIVQTLLDGGGLRNGSRPCSDCGRRSCPRGCRRSRSDRLAIRRTQRNAASS